MYAVEHQANSGNSMELALQGNSGYRLLGERVVINIDGIANRRSAGDVSGTLAVELWALQQPYSGDAFSGVCLAGTQIGELFGQHYLSGCEYDLLFSAPGAGQWQLALMLREWTDAGFVTRDFVNFALPYVVEETRSLVSRSDKDNVINVSFAPREEEQVQKMTEAPQALPSTGCNPQSPKARELSKTKAQVKSESVKAEVATTQPEAKTVASKAKAEVPSKSEPLQAKAGQAQSATKSATAAKASSQPAVAKAGSRTSNAKTQVKDNSPAGLQWLNKASLDEIARLQGVSRKLAERIVAKRPYARFEEVLDVKGMGQKLFAKIRPFIER